MVMQYADMSGNSENWQPASGPDTVEASDLAAALLLGRVESMVRNGQPVQAVNHIIDMTQVDRAMAEEFVAELKTRLFA